MAGPHPAVAAVRGAVADALSDLPDGALVLVACSGGVDSLALAAATGFVATRRGRRRWRVGAVVVDHGMQPGSAEVAEVAADACRALGLDPVSVVRVDVRGPGGPEAAARHARYAALEAAAARLGAASVLLGHTRDDQAEGVLLGLARGSGARSLAGMPAERGVLRRPLLAVTREQTEAACAALGLRPWRDPTNAAPAGAEEPLLRSRVRDRVLPVLERELGPGVADALVRTADQLREDADALDALAAVLLDRAVRPGDDDAVLLDVAVLVAELPALRTRALRAAAARAGAPAGALTRAHIRTIDGLLTDWHGQGPLHLPGRVEVSRSCGRLALRAAPPLSTDPGGPGREDVGR